MPVEIPPMMVGYTEDGRPVMGIRSPDGFFLRVVVGSHPVPKGLRITLELPYNYDYEDPYAST